MKVTIEWPPLDRKKFWHVFSGQVCHMAYLTNQNLQLRVSRHRTSFVRVDLFAARCTFESFWELWCSWKMQWKQYHVICAFQPVKPLFNLVIWVNRTIISSGYSESCLSKNKCREKPILINIFLQLCSSNVKFKKGFRMYKTSGLAGSTEFYRMSGWVWSNEFYSMS